MTPDAMPGDAAADIDVSIIMPAWKAASFIHRAVASALASTGVRVEAIVVDDASPDGTFEAVRALAAADARVIVDRAPTNGGPSLARNRAIDLARGRYIAILDADDAMAPERLASLAALGDASGADIVVDNMVEVDEDATPLGSGAFLKSPRFQSEQTIDLETWVRFNQPLKQADCLGYLKPLFRRATLVRTGLRYDPVLRNSEDYYLVAHLLAAGARMTYTPHAGYLYTRSAASTSHRLLPAQAQAWLVAEREFRARYAASLSPAETSALDVRGRVLREVNHFVSTVDAIKARRPAEFARLIVSDPAASAFTLGALARIALGKATGRKLV